MVAWSRATEASWVSLGSSSWGPPPARVGRSARNNKTYLLNGDADLVCKYRLGNCVVVIKFARAWCWWLFRSVDVVTDTL